MVDRSRTASTAKLRMRNYREGIKSEAQRLHADIVRLEEKRRLLVETVSYTPRPRARRPYALATDVLQSHSNGLRTKVEEQKRVIRALTAWVAMQRPHPDLFWRTSWIESTLVADPVCRRQGYRWLSERAYHMTQQSYSAHDFRGHDQVSTELLTSAADPGWEVVPWQDEVKHVVEGAYTRAEFTVFSSFAVVARGYWDEFTEGIPTSPMVEWADESGDLVYFISVNPVVGTTKQSILRRFRPSPHQVVFTIVNVAVDENVPLKEGQMRTHGMCSMVLDEVSPGVTLVRSTDLALTPLTCHGKVSLNVMGMFHRMAPKRAEESPTLYLEKVRSIGDAHRDAVMWESFKTTNDLMAQLEAETSPADA